MEVMVNTVVLSTDRAWTRFEVNPGPQRIKNSLSNGKRVKGIEPSCPAWEAGVLPLNYTRVEIISDLKFRIADWQLAQLLPGNYIVGLCVNVVTVRIAR